MAGQKILRRYVKADRAQQRHIEKLISLEGKEIQFEEEAGANIFFLLRRIYGDELSKGYFGMIENHAAFTEASHRLEQLVGSLKKQGVKVTLKVTLE